VVVIFRHGTTLSPSGGAVLGRDSLSSGLLPGGIRRLDHEGLVTSDFAQSARGPAVISQSRYWGPDKDGRSRPIAIGPRRVSRHAPPIRPSSPYLVTPGLARKVGPTRRPFPTEHTPGLASCRLDTSQTAAESIAPNGLATRPDGRITRGRHSLHPEGAWRLPRIAAGPRGVGGHDGHDDVVSSRSTWRTHRTTRKRANHGP
jgi:hypothetical protein